MFCGYQNKHPLHKDFLNVFPFKILLEFPQSPPNKIGWIFWRAKGCYFDICCSKIKKQKKTKNLIFVDENYCYKAGVYQYHYFD